MQGRYGYQYPLSSRIIYIHYKEIKIYKEKFILYKTLWNLSRLCLFHIFWKKSQNKPEEQAERKDR